MEASQLIRAVRLEAGLTQAELARRVGTSQAAVARLERGGANPRVGTLARVVAATGRQLELLTRAAGDDVDEAQIVRHLGLTPAERAKAHDRAYANAGELVRGSRQSA